MGPKELTMSFIKCKNIEFLLVILIHIRLRSVTFDMLYI